MNFSTVSRVLVMTALVTLFLAGCSKGHSPVEPATDQSGGILGTHQTVNQESRVILGEYKLYIDLNNETAWLESGSVLTRNAGVSHSSVLSYLLSNVKCLGLSATPIRPCVTVEAEFESGDGTKLDMRNMVRIDVRLHNEVVSIGSVTWPILRDIRWIFDREYMDVWNLAFISPNGYTSLFDGDDLHPYRTFCLDDPDRALYNYQFDQENCDAEASLLFMIGTDPDYDWEEVDDVDPPDDDDGLVILKTLIDCALHDGTDPIDPFHTEEPVGIFTGGDPGNKLVHRLDAGGQEDPIPQTFIITDWQGSWNDISCTADLTDFYPQPDFDDDWGDPYGAGDILCEVTTNFDFHGIAYPGGLYEVPISFIQDDIDENFEPTNDPVYSDSIEYIQYFYQQRNPLDLYKDNITATDGYAPVATSPRFIELESGGGKYFVGVFHDRTLIKIGEDGNGFASWSTPTPPYPARNDFCLGAPAFSDQNCDGVLDVIIGTWMLEWVIGLPHPLNPLSQGRVFCIDGDTWTMIWTMDYATDEDGGLGDIVASPLIAELDDSNDAEEVIIMLDNVPSYEPHIRILQYDCTVEEVTEIDYIEIEDPSPQTCTLGVRSNGALIDPLFTEGDVWLACVSVGNPLNTTNYVHIFNLSDGGAEEEVSTAIVSDPADVFEKNSVHMGLVAGDVNGDSLCEVLLVRRDRILIFDQDLSTFETIMYGAIDATQKGEEDIDELSGSSDDWQNEASLPALGDMNHNGNPDIVFGLDGWVVALSYVNQGPDAGRYDSVFAYKELDGRFWSPPALADHTRDGFLDVIIGSGDWSQNPHNMIGIDGSPLNNHNFGVQEDRRLWTTYYYEGSNEYRAVGMGPAVMNGEDDLLLAGCTYTMTYISPFRSSWCTYLTRYEGHGVKEDYPPPPESDPDTIIWPWYLADRYNSACYNYSP